MIDFIDFSIKPSSLKTGIIIQSFIPLFFQRKQLNIY